MEFAVRRHHLIEEAKAELDIAYEEVKRAEQEIMASQALYNAKSKGMTGEKCEPELRALLAETELRQVKYGIDALYELQRVAIQRFSQISSVFTIVHSVESADVAIDLIRQLLFRADDAAARRGEIDEAIGAFARSLKAYSLETSSIENDRKVRESWQDIERLLSEIGRPVRRTAACQVSPEISA